MTAEPRRLTYDAPGVVVGVGDGLVSMKTGATWLVLEQRTSHRTSVLGRNYLTVVRVPLEALAGAPEIHPLYWHRSKKKR